jgi:glycosyltransferase involved in cell wall biosynthesis
MATPRYPPLTGGIETHVREVSRRLVERGAAVTVLTTDRDGVLPPQESDRGVLVHRVRAYPARADYYWSPGVYRMIVRARWDVVHCQGIHTLVPPLAMLAAVRMGIPFVVTFHTGGHASRIRHRLRTLQWRALAPLLSRAAGLIAVSPFEMQLFARIPGIDATRIRVIPNGAERPALGREAVAPDPDLVVSVGRLERYKGHQHAIAAVAYLRAERPRVRLRIAGSGPFKAELERLAQRLGVQDRVTIAPIPSEDRGAMARLLGSAGVVVLLSEYEAHPIAVMEALALGRPVVVTDTTGLHDLVGSGLVRGVSAPPAVGAVAGAILAELDRPGPAPLQLPTWDECADAVLDTYREAIGQSKK